MSKQGSENPSVAQETTAELPSGVSNTRRTLSIPRKGNYLIIHSHRGIYLCLLLFRQSKKDSNSEEPYAYAVKVWHPDDGFFTKTLRFVIEYNTVRKFDDFEKAKHFYEGLI